MKRLLTRQSVLMVVVLLAAFLIAGVSVYAYVMPLQVAYQEAQKEVIAQEVRIQDLEDLISEKDEQVEVHKQLLQSLRQEVASSAYDFSQIKAMVAGATQTIEDIKKLEEADKELLAKYSKVYFLNEHYEPGELLYIPSEYVLSNRDLQIKSEVRPYLMSLLESMETTGLSPRIVSAYRSYGYQEHLKHNHTVTYGTTVANQFVADQGYSEHQLGTTFDMVTEQTGPDLSLFEGTPEFVWLTKNAHRFGFTLSYPESNAYYAYEPWHWRFVGVELATQLYQNGVYFYDIPQRDIDTYRLKLFE